MDQLITVFSAEALTVPVCTVRLLLSFVAGCILGLERKFRMQFVGMRTLVLICVSSSLLMMLSVYTVQTAAPLSGDPARIAAQVVSGIGFLGAGAILRHGLNVKGLTSAAIIWAAAALGLAIGAGFLIPAGIALIISLFSLVGIERFEERRFPVERMKTLCILCGQNVPDSIEIEKIAVHFEIILAGLQAASVNRDDRVVLKYDVRIPPYVDFYTFASRLQKECGVMDVSLE